MDDPIEVSVQLQFQTEKLSRTIEDCQDIDILRGIAMELLKLHQKKSAIAQWAAKRAAQAELRALNAEMDSNRLRKNLSESI